MTQSPVEGSVADPDRDAKLVTASVGGSFHVHLWEDRTRGEQWVPSYEAGSLVLVNDDFLRTASGNAVDAGRRAFEFRAVTPGTHRLLFEKRMGWKFTAEDRRVFLVRVVDGASRLGRSGGA
ncbi:MAG: protease inhibitor I42 family protein [Nitrospirae bacterium]|nr:protease inhibitor I42 family protein [Nitrospirota bacterium]